MTQWNYCVPCLLGLESSIASELRKLQMSEVRSENGRVFFKGNAQDAARANINLRTGERVLIELGQFHAESFEELFEGTRALAWESLLPKNARFPVKGYSLDSKLFSVSDCQSIIKKAVCRRLGSAYVLDWLPEDGPLYQIRFSIMKDRVSLCVDTTGPGLYKRGYRPIRTTAPLKETLSAAMVGFARYKGRGDFCDPFCGSGVLAIEAALIARNLAPGRNRRFTAMEWPDFPEKIWRDAIEEADARTFDREYRIFASDIDPEAVAMAKENAARAGVLDTICFETLDARRFNRVTEDGVIVTNPPYGQRLSDIRSAERLYADFGKAYFRTDNWRLCLLSSHTEFERCFGGKADKKRKLYNGMIKCDLFIYDRRSQDAKTKRFSGEKRSGTYSEPGAAV